MASSASSESYGPGRHHRFPLAVNADVRGKLAVIEAGKDIPFPIARVYHLYDVPARAERGGHAHKDLHQVLIAVSGSFDVDIETATDSHSYNLNAPDAGLYIGPWVWREMRNFSSNAVCLVLASAHYDEADYIRSMDQFRTLAGATR